MTDHDQSFKNLILDYPRQALDFFAAEEAASIADDAKITPIRQEQLQERLGERFFELDVPLLVEDLSGNREAIIFVFEEETEPRKFSIHRLIYYCVAIAELMELDQIVPVVIFLHAGDYPLSFRLGSPRTTYLDFRYISCDLSQIPVENYLTSQNIVARINLPNLRQTPEQRLDSVIAAHEGLLELEANYNKQSKYFTFIEQYANLNDDQKQRYVNDYLPISRFREQLMSGPLTFFEERGVKKGIGQGIEQGIEQGIKQGIEQERQRSQEQLRLQTLSSIELGLELKFGTAGLKLMPTLRKITDMDVLQTVFEGIKTADSVDELRQLFE